MARAKFYFSLASVNPNPYGGSFVPTLHCEVMDFCCTAITPDEENSELDLSFPRFVPRITCISFQGIFAGGWAANFMLLYISYVPPFSLLPLYPALCEHVHSFTFVFYFNSYTISRAGPPNWLSIYDHYHLQA
jgi:hypothetical protein